MSRIARCILMAGLLIAATGAMSAVQVSVNMRDTGYTLGDLIQYQATLVLPAGGRIDPASLPPLGRVTPWLELRLVTQIAENRLDFTWQTFATVETAQPLAVPAVEIKLQGNQPQTVVIPPQTFLMSPVLPKPLENTRPRPDLPPFRFDERTPLQLSVGLSSLALLCGVTWLWLTDRLPGLPRHPGPMTRLARMMRHRRTLDADTLRAIHAALNSAAGETLYPDTLPRLFQHARYLEAERTAIETFYSASWAKFFGGLDIQLPSIEATRGWIKRAAVAERLKP